MKDTATGAIGISAEARATICRGNGWSAQGSSHSLIIPDGVDVDAEGTRIVKASLSGSSSAFMELWLIRGWLMTIRTTGQALASARQASSGAGGASDARSTELVVVPVAENEWRVSDPARSLQGKIPLIGFVKEIDDLFEVTQLGSPHEHLRFGSLALALAYLQWPNSGSA